MECEKTVEESEYQKLNIEFTDKDFGYSQQIFSQDIDYSSHTNNVIYVRLLMNLLSCDFFDRHKIQEFEIHYINETKEGNDLKMYKIEKENMIEFLIKSNDKEIVRAILKYI